jgi:hypothetical protein
MSWRLLLIVILSLPLVVNAQSRRRKSKISNSEGTLFLSWGYHRSWYSGSKLRLNGPGYQLEMTGFRATDNPSLNILDLPTTQFNARIGYYFKNGYALSLGWDKMSYDMVNGQAILLNGTADGSSTTGFNGSYFNESVFLDSGAFVYALPSMNHINLKLSRTGRSVRFGRNESFVISTDLGASFGVLLNQTDYRLGSFQDYGTSSLSGITLAAHAGIRFEFFKHIYLEPSLSGGYMNQIRNRLLEYEPNSYANQQLGYLQFETTLGILLYVRPTNDCNSCPQW